MEKILMYAVMMTNGKQYRVLPGTRLKVQRFDKAAVGDIIEFDKILMVNNDSEATIGHPYVVGAKVLATVQSHGRLPKIRVIKFKRRKGYLRCQGHRQDYTEVQINKITAGTQDLTTNGT